MRIIKEVLKRPKSGQFAVEPEKNFALDWIYCRDRFMSYFTSDIDGFYFSQNGDSSKVSAFVFKTEVILELAIKSEFILTNRFYATWVEPSPFWKTNFIRRSLFTLLLRAGNAYDPKIDNYEEALYSDNLLKETKQAVMRFLFGFTECPVEESNHKFGWWETFHNKSIEETRRLLISYKNNEPSIIGCGSIWR
jgi:hypothetical protein